MPRDFHGYFQKALPRARVRAVCAFETNGRGVLEPGAACRQSWGGYGAAPARKDRPGRLLPLGAKAADHVLGKEITVRVHFFSEEARNFFGVRSVGMSEKI